MGILIGINKNQNKKGRPKQSLKQYLSEESMSVEFGPIFIKFGSRCFRYWDSTLSLVAQFCVT